MARPRPRKAWLWRLVAMLREAPVVRAYEYGATPGSSIRSGRTPASGWAGYQKVARKRLFVLMLYRFVRDGSFITRSSDPTAYGPVGLENIVGSEFVKVR